MATMEKLVKSLEALKIQQLTPSLTDDSALRRKEKIGYCLTIADTMCYAGVRSSSNFLHLLSVAIELLLQLCDDPHSDVRMVADESLNRIIRALSDSNVVKIQVELHKEIKKNGKARTLRAALWRFAELCYLIRPQKCKPYVLNLMPCIVHIARRTEESVLETLAAAMPKIFKALGNFTTDNDIKGLLKAFLQNLTSTSAVVRRTATSCILTVCLNCRKPHVFISYVLNTLLDCVVPLRENQSVPNVLGVLGCLRNLLPHVSAAEGSEEMRGSFGVRRRHQASPLAVDRMIQVYELCLHFTRHPDHNVVNAALETLSQLLQAPPADLVPVLVAPAGITRSRIHPGEPAEKLTRRTLSQMSVAMSLIPGDEDSLLDPESELVPRVNLPSVRAWVDNIGLVPPPAAPATPGVVDEGTNTSPQEEEGPSVGSVLDDSAEYSNIVIGTIQDNDVEGLPSLADVTPAVQPAALSNQSEHSSDEVKEVSSPSPTSSTPANVPYKDVNVGSVTDAEVALVHCARHIASLFLLTGVPGNTVPDPAVRVSVKALALACLASVLRIYPALFHATLDKNDDNTQDENTQLMSDVLLFAKHADPQLRGITGALVGAVIQSGLLQAEGDLSDWLSHGPITLQHLVHLLLMGLEDESSVCCRQTLTTISQSLTDLLESVDSRAGLPLLKALPPVVNNPYWLVKVKLVEVVSDLPFVTIQHLTGNCDFQDKVIGSVVVVLLGDDDARVRHATAMAITRLIPRLFYASDHPNQDPIIAKATSFSTHYLSQLLLSAECPTNPTLSQRSNANSLPSPFNGCQANKHSETTEAALSRIVNLLSQSLLMSSSKHLTFGCCEALSQLSLEYLTTVFPHAWNCVMIKSPAKKPEYKRTISQQGTEPPHDVAASPASGLVAMAMALMTSSPISLDLSCQMWLIKLASHLTSGLAVCSLRPVEVIIPVGADKHMWNVFKDKQLSIVAEQLLVHTVRMLNIVVHVMDDTVPHVPAPKPTLPTLPTLPTSHVLSPKRKDKSDPGRPSPPSNKDKEDKADERKTSRPGQPLGFFAGIPHYMRVYDLVKSAYTNYKTTLDTEASEKFVCLLTAILESLARLLEVATLLEAGRIADELLAYLRVTVAVDPTTTVQCVQQLLKCLFGTNLSGQWEEPEEKKPPVAAITPPVTGRGFYSECFQTPYRRLQEYINTPTETRDKDEGSMWMNYLRRKAERKASSAFKGFNRGADKASLASYIRLFEPMVIKALKQYTVTSDVKLQCRVLLLLSQLVQLRVNYCLLDSDQIFIGFVLKQFEFIEEGQIPDPQELIPKIFYFLVHLSYEKHHSKSIISVPKVIQLCDGLMASGQSPITHCIPALVPVVEDVFLVRGVGSSGADLKELETQREVLVAMLLRLVEYYQVLELLSIVLSEAQSQVDGEERWRRWSRQVLDTLLPLLGQGRVRLECRAAQQALQRLLGAAAPSALRPCDQLLRTLFSESPHSESSTVATERWLGMVLATLLHLLTYSKEDAILSRLEELDLALPPLGPPRDPLNVGCSAGAHHAGDAPPEQVLARFLVRVVGLVGSHLYYSVFATAAAEDWRYLHEQFSHFLLYCIHMFESGSYRRVATAAMHLIQGQGANDLPTSDLNTLFSELATKCPLITFQWCYLLTLLGYNDQTFWARILRTQPSILHDTADQPSCSQQQQSPCISLEVVRKGGVILYCDFVCENVGEAEVLTWLLVNHMDEVVGLSHEPPVHELIAAVHRNSAASGLLVQAVASRCTNLDKPGFVSRMLRCLWPVHPSQSGPLLALLVPRLVSLRQVALARQAGALACRRAELLLALPQEEVARQMTQEGLTAVLKTLHAEGLAKKHSGLLSLLNKLGSQCYNMPPFDGDTKKGLDPEAIRAISVDKTWFLSQVKQRCYQRDTSGAESAQLLSHLPYDDILTVLASRSMNIATLQDCIQLGTQLTLQAYQRLPPRKIGYDSVNYISDDELCDLESPLYKASQLSLLNNIQNIRSLLPRPHQVFNPLGREPSAKESKFSKRLDQLFTDETFWHSVFEIAPAVSCYLDSLPQLARGGVWPGVPPQDSWQCLAKFGILCLEAVSWLILTQPTASPQCLEAGLRCAELVLREANLSAVIGQAANVSYLGSASAAVTRVVLLLLEGGKLPALPPHGLSAALEDPDTVCAAHSCHQLATLVLLLEKTHCGLPSIPPFLSEPIKSLIVSLSRMPLVNSYVATPPEVWRQGWSCDLVGPAKTTVPPLPVDYLQDVELLQQLIFRVTLLGWTSRQQFEETWMSFLSLLSSNPHDNSGPEDAALMIHASSLAVGAITSLLVQTLLLPTPGNPNASRLIHQPREKTLPVFADSNKLKVVHELLSWKLNELPVTKARFGNVYQRANMERINSRGRYGFSQVSLEYLWTATRIMTEGDNEKGTVSALCLAREQCLASSGLDLHSCLHFLLDLYSQWLQPNSGTPLRLVNQAISSMLAISDLFTERAQFQWLLSTCLEHAKTHPVEDELTHQNLVLGACKAAAVLRPDSDTFERIRKLVETSLRSAFLPARITGLHGILYLLQCGGGGAAVDEMAHVLPLAIEYIQRHIDGWAAQTEEHNLLVWGLVFYLMETVEEAVMETELSPVVLQLALTLATATGLPESLHLALLNGLERLIASKAIAGKVSEQVTKLAVERLRHPSSDVCIPGLQLLLTCMYTGDHKDIVKDPEQLIEAMEKTSALFDRIKRGYPLEVELLCGVLPHLLTDFFPPSEILTKVIGEFLSPQQPHPRHLAAVVFQVFEQACQQSQLPLIQDWVVLSLANFTQCSPVGMATWCVTCFFVGASANPWLRALFPHVQSRIGRLEADDRRLLCVAARDFYGGLTDAVQRETFVDTLDKATQSPFSELVAFL